MPTAMLKTPIFSFLKKFAGCLFGHLLALFAFVLALVLYIALREGALRWMFWKGLGSHTIIYRSSDPFGYWLTMGMALFMLWVVVRLSFGLYRHCLGLDPPRRRRKRARRSKRTPAAEQPVDQGQE